MSSSTLDQRGAARLHRLNAILPLPQLLFAFLAKSLMVEIREQLQNSGRWLDVKEDGRVTSIIEWAVDQVAMIRNRDHDDF